MTEQWLVHLAGSSWTATRGTDHRLVQALSEHLHILWVDPPRPVFGRATGWRIGLDGPPRVGVVAPRVTRLVTEAPPGATRLPSRVLAGHLQRRLVERFLVERSIHPVGTVVASPLATFLRTVGGHRVLYVTDDWSAGAELMGISRRAVRRMLRTNLRTADTVMSVSPVLTEHLIDVGRRTVGTLPNGCSVTEALSSSPSARRPVAIVVGQLNERLDLDLLEAVRASGIPLEIVGPLRVRESNLAAKWRSFLTRSGVTWMGEVTEADVSRQLASAGVGLTPYRRTTFNDASFPLKTLEYLASGLPVVSTDLPANRWLDCNHIRVGRDHEEFVAQVREELAIGPRQEAEDRRVAFARLHTWEARARELLSAIPGSGL